MVSRTAPHASLRVLVRFAFVAVLTAVLSSFLTAATLADHGVWSRLPPVAPEAMALDPAGERLIAFTSTQGEPMVWTLALNGTSDWQMIVPQGTGPIGSVDHAFYDQVRQRVITLVGVATETARDAMPNGVDPLFTSNVIRVALGDGSSGGDQAPDGTGGIAYVFDSTPLHGPGSCVTRGSLMFRLRAPLGGRRTGSDEGSPAVSR